MKKKVAIRKNRSASNEAARRERETATKYDNKYNNEYPILPPSTSPLRPAEPKRDASLSPDDKPAPKKLRVLLTPHETTGRSGTSEGLHGAWGLNTVERVRADNDTDFFKAIEESRTQDSDPDLATAIAQSLAEADQETQKKEKGKMPLIDNDNDWDYAKAIKASLAQDDETNLAKGIAQSLAHAAVDRPEGSKSPVSQPARVHIGCGSASGSQVISISDSDDDSKTDDAALTRGVHADGEHKQKAAPAMASAASSTPKQTSYAAATRLGLGEDEDDKEPEVFPCCAYVPGMCCAQCNPGATRAMETTNVEEGFTLGEIDVHEPEVNETENDEGDDGDKDEYDDDVVITREIKYVAF